MRRNWQDLTLAPLQRDDPLKRQTAHFIAVARGALAPLVSAADGLANLRVTEAIARSAASGGLVQV